MQSISVNLIGTKWPRYFIGCGDLHMGSENCHTEGFRKCMEDCAKHTWAGHGDMVEAIAPGDRRYSIEEKQDAMFDSVRAVADMISPAAKTCATMVSGNHDGNLSKMIGGIQKHICYLSNAPYGGATSYINLTGADKPISWLVAHGRKTFLGRAGDVERREVSREIALRDYTSHFVADVVGLGHGHFGIVSPPTYQQKMQPDLIRRPTLVKAGWRYMTPSFLRNYGPNGGYAEEALLPSSDLGWVRIYVDKSGEIPVAEIVNENGAVVQEVKPKVIA